MKRALSHAPVIVLLFLAVLSASAQRNLSVASPVTEAFALGTGTVSLTDNSTILGVYAARTVGNATPNSLPANNGASGTAGLYNMGSTAASDRALGSISDGTTGTNYFGIRLVNFGATTISSITVQYTGETWRHGTGVIPETLTFDYQTGATVTSLTTGTWTPVAALTYTNPNNPVGQGPLDGNAVGNRATITATFAVTILAGTEIMLRWSDIVNTGQPDGLAIDDVTVTAIGPTAADARISGRVTDAFGRSISYAAITVQDSNGTSKVVMTNTFGYYRIEGLEAGETYVLTVSSRRYTFTNASMVINLGDNFDGANFVARR